MFENFAQTAAAWAAKLPFDTLIWIVWGSYGGVFALTFILTLALPHVRAASKKPFLCLGYAYTALTFAAFLTPCRGKERRRPPPHTRPFPCKSPLIRP